jgi:hypothetical protein
MVWHIFNKDWKLMWKSAAAIVALQLAVRVYPVDGRVRGRQ